MQHLDLTLGDSGLDFNLEFGPRIAKILELLLKEKKKAPDIRVRAYLYFKINIQLIIKIQFFKMYPKLRMGARWRIKSGTGKETVCIVQYTTSKVLAFIGEITHHAEHQRVIIDSIVNFNKTAPQSVSSYI